MKKSLIIVIGLLAIFPKLQAQTEIHKLTFFFKGGYNHTVISGNETNGGKTGFVGSTIYGAFGIEKGIAESKFVIGVDNEPKSASTENSPSAINAGSHL